MVFSRWLLWLCLCLLLPSCVSPRMSQEVQRGRVLFLEGNYKPAFRQLLPLAVNGNAQAQYAVGYMYYYGFGVSRDTESGLFWMYKSANQGYLPAIKALNIINAGPTREGPCLTRPEGCRRFSYKGENNVEVQGYPNYQPAPVIRSAPNYPNYQPAPVVRPVPYDPNYQPAPVHRTYRSYLKNSGYSLNETPQLPVLPEQPKKLASLSVSETMKQSKSDPSLREAQRRGNPVAFPKNDSSEKTLSSGVSTTPKKLDTSNTPTPVQEQKVIKTTELSETQNHAKKYALQLFGAYQLADTQNLQSTIKQKTQIFHAKNKDQDWYVLTYGQFDSTKDAVLAKNQLPDPISQFKPWIRNVSELEVV